MQCKQVTQDLL